jgi:hypothetical protein
VRPPPRPPGRLTRFRSQSSIATGAAPSSSVAAATSEDRRRSRDRARSRSLGTLIRTRTAGAVAGPAGVFARWTMAALSCRLNHELAANGEIVTRSASPRLRPSPAIGDSADPLCDVVLCTISGADECGHLQEAMDHVVVAADGGVGPPRSVSPSSTVCLHRAAGRIRQRLRALAEGHSTLARTAAKLAGRAGRRQLIGIG